MLEKFKAIGGRGKRLLTDFGETSVQEEDGLTEDLGARRGYQVEKVG